MTSAFLLSFAIYTSIKYYALDSEPIAFSDSGHELFSRLLYVNLIRADLDYSGLSSEWVYQNVIKNFDTWIAE